MVFTGLALPHCVFSDDTHRRHFRGHCVEKSFFVTQCKKGKKNGCGYIRYDAILGV